MKRTLLSLFVVLMLFSPVFGVTAQEVPSPVPEATAEAARVGESGPGFGREGQRPGTAEFVEMVIQDVNITWANLFQSWGYSYVPPTYVTIEDGAYARSSCGINAGNPTEDPSLNPALYCIYGGELGTQAIGSSDVFETQVVYSPVIYLSIPWLEESSSTNASNADFTVAYRVAHEVAHHIEYLLGYIDHTGGGCCGYTDEQIDLSADCLTGVWAYSAYDEGQLAEPDVKGAQVAAWGDGADLPEEFGRKADHGNPQQRLLSLMTGYENGNASLCLEGDPGG